MRGAAIRVPFGRRVPSRRVTSANALRVIDAKEDIRQALKQYDVHRDLGIFTQADSVET